MLNNMIKALLIAAGGFFIGWKLGDWFEKRKESKKDKPLNS